MARSILLIPLLLALPVRGEERTFAVTVDGQPAGELVLDFRPSSGNAINIDVRAKHRVERPVLISFDYRGTETWKEGRLVRLEGLGSDGTLKGGATLVAGKDAYALKAGVKEVSV